jgi:hypothetical protein
LLFWRFAFAWHTIRLFAYWVVFRFLWGSFALKSMPMPLQQAGAAMVQGLGFSLRNH